MMPLHRRWRKLNYRPSLLDLMLGALGMVTIALVFWLFSLAWAIDHNQENPCLRSTNPAFTTFLLRNT